MCSSNVLRNVLQYLLQEEDESMKPEQLLRSYVLFTINKKNKLSGKWATAFSLTEESLTSEGIEAKEMRRESSSGT